MLRHVAPAGAPIHFADLARWAGVAISTRDVPEAFRARLRTRFAVRHCVLTSTGRAGMTLLLKALRRLAPPSRDEVVLPSYTCYSVAASVVKAGLRPRIVDISATTLDFSPEALANTDFSRVLALVATNLYGLPNDLPALHRLTRDRGVFLVDDAAQAMGASVGGQWSGTWGDAGLFSFDKGKNVSAIDGGVVVTNSDEIAAALEQETSRFSSPSSATSAVHVAKALAYSVMLRPWLYGIPTRIPQLALGKTIFTTDFPLERFDPILAALGLAMLSRLDSFTRARVANAATLRDGLATLQGARTVVPTAGASPVYLRMPILFTTRASRDGAVAALNEVGIGATASYPASLADVAELRPLLANQAPAAAGGRHVASCIATLPTHPLVTTRDTRTMISTLTGLDRPAATATSTACIVAPLGRSSGDAATFERTG